MFIDLNWLQAETSPYKLMQQNPARHKLHGSFDKYRDRERIAFLKMSQLTWDFAVIYI